jgi:cell division protein FtsW
MVDDGSIVRRPAPDALLIGSVTCLVALGLVMVFSASNTQAPDMPHDGWYYFGRQVLWLCAGSVPVLCAYFVDLRRLRALAPLALGLSVVSLALVLIPHVGSMAGGARRWLGFGPISFQPSEFAKLGLVIYLAAALSAKGDRIRSFSHGLAPVAIVSAVLAMLVLREPDFGTASLFAFIAGILMFVAGARLVHLLAMAFATLPFVIFVIVHDSYKLARVWSFMHPSEHEQNEGFQVWQSLLALGGGGAFGRGLGLSRQKFMYLPEAHTDFIGSIVGEELGFIGMLAIVVLFLAFAYRAVRIALHAQDRFGFFLALGCMAMIVVQAFVSIGVVSATWPVTGVPLPFISFGGSSLVVSLVAVALVANVGRQPRSAPA